MRLTAAILALMAMAIVGCNSYGGATDEGLPVWQGHEIAAIATPLGPVYFGHSMSDSSIREHEWCHIQRMEQIGTLNFMVRYFNDPEWACREERLCGWDGPHPRCIVSNEATSTGSFGDQPAFQLTQMYR